MTFKIAKSYVAALSDRGIVPDFASAVEAHRAELQHHFEHHQKIKAQPTWIEAPSIAFKTMMRADLKVGDEVMMPKTLIRNTQQAMSSLINQNVAQQGNFILTSMRHIGNYKQPDAYAWVTEFNAVPKQIQSAT